MEPTDANPFVLEMSNASILRIPVTPIIPVSYTHLDVYKRQDHDSVEDDSIQIIRTKRFGIKPMFPEDACIQMELLGHNFYVFTNAETDEVNVVYKRKNNTYGLIEPEFQ